MTRSVRLNTPFIKLDQLLKFAEVASSGGEASAFISGGLISRDGVILLERGKKIRPGDTVRCRIPGMEEIILEILEQEP